jgi:predicted ATPase
VRPSSISRRCYFSRCSWPPCAPIPQGDVDALRRLGGSADLPYWVVHDLANAIHAAATDTPLAIVLEDIHWADNGTLLALRSLTTARRDVPVLWVLTVRTGAGGPAVQETLSVLQRADATFVLVAAILGATMKQRLDQLSDGAGEVVREAAVLPDRFSAGLLAAMLERQPASLMSAIEEAVRADLLVEDEDSARG